MGITKRKCELIKKLEKGDKESFKELDEFLEQFETGELRNLRKTAIQKCFRYYKRVYAQKHANYCLQQAIDSQSNPEELNCFLKQAEFYFQRLT